MRPNQVLDLCKLSYKAIKGKVVNGNAINNVSRYSKKVETNSFWFNKCGKKKETAYIKNTLNLSETSIRLLLLSCSICNSKLFKRISRKSRSIPLFVIHRLQEVSLALIRILSLLSIKRLIFISSIELSLTCPSVYL